MTQKTVPAPVVVAVIVVVVLVVGVFLYKGWTGGTVGTGKPGSIVAAPPGSTPNMQREEAASHPQRRY